MYYIFTNNRAFFMYKLIHMDDTEVHLTKYYINSAISIGRDPAVYSYDFFIKNMELYDYWNTL